MSSAVAIAVSQELDTGLQALKKQTSFSERIEAAAIQADSLLTLTVRPAAKKRARPAPRIKRRAK